MTLIKNINFIKNKLYLSFLLSISIVFTPAKLFASFVVDSEMINNFISNFVININFIYTGMKTN